MLKDKKVETLQNRVKNLTETVKTQAEEIDELKNRIISMQAIVEAAEKYTEEHQKAMFVLAESKDKYDIAYKEILKLKKDYEKRMENVLKKFE